jgi:hypothetical protein
MSDQPDSQEDVGQDEGFRLVTPFGSHPLLLSKDTQLAIALYFLQNWKHFQNIKTTETLALDIRRPPEDETKKFLPEAWNTWLRSLMIEGDDYDKIANLMSEIESTLSVQNKYQDEIAEIIRQNSLARSLAETHGVRFDELWYKITDSPLEIPFTTPSRLRDAGVTKYSDARIRALFNQKNLPQAVRVGERQIILGVFAVERILERERKRLTGQLVTKGTLPGQTSPFKGSRRRPRTT